MHISDFSQDPLFIGVPFQWSDSTGKVSAAEFLGRVQSAKTYCLSLQVRRVALFHDEVVPFAVWLFALLSADIEVVLLPNNKPHTVQETVSQVDTVWLQPDWLPSAPTVCDLSISDQAQLWFLTSGSTGAPKLVGKQFWQLQKEVQTLQQTFQCVPQSGAVLFAATVPHYHIYGLLFRLLWPLQHGATLYSATIEFQEQWLALQRFDTAVTLISSPAHISRYEGLQLVQNNASQLCRVFCSGGPLANRDAAAFFLQTGYGVIEVVGSTETGGIGWRQYQSEQSLRPWQAFTGIELSLTPDQCLRLRTPYLAATWHDTTDYAELLDAPYFVLCGRADRIVKLEEKRLALAEVESLCNQLPWLQQAAALLVSAPSERGRVQLGLVVELSHEGQEYLNVHGKRALNQQIRQALSQRFESVLLPRKFRYVSRLPFNEQGKLPLQQLEALFLS
ncbi:MAG: acyl-CoA synthetase [Rheinheimera sp.]|nr:MAG: acyl-CoA synthetase [Rheinheimera sp.]